MTRLAEAARWCGGDGWRTARQRLLRRRHRRRRAHCGGTVRLGAGRRRRISLAVSRLVRWRLVAELLRPIRKALMDMAAAAGRRQLVALPLLNFPFVGTLSLPAIVA